jgi:hypothetical protein
MDKQFTFSQCILIVLLALIFLIIFHYIKQYTSKSLLSDFTSSDTSEHMINIEPINSDTLTKWNRNECKYMMNDTLSNVLNANNIKQSNDNWDLFFPCGYDEINKEIEQLPVKENGKYFIIDNIDLMTAKEWLWLNVLKHHGITKTLTMMPQTYVLYHEQDMKRFNEDYNTSKIYIMKKNIQRQEGLKISNDKDEINNGYKKNGYVLAQELLQDPYMISKRKTNMRFYVLILCKQGDMEVYVYNDGFMYYTKDFFKKGDTSTETNITTGYIDRKIYEENPLTHKDFMVYLDKSERDLSIIEQHIRSQGLVLSQIVFHRIYALLVDIFFSFTGIICQMKKIYNNIKFQLFGVDIAVNDQLYPMCMEINKGPDMGAKDDRDSNLKHGVITDLMRIIKSVDENKFTEPNGFIKILDVGNGVMNKV